MRAVALAFATGVVLIIVGVPDMVLGAVIGVVAVIVIALVVWSEVGLWRRARDPYRFGAGDPRR